MKKMTLTPAGMSYWWCGRSCDTESVCPCDGHFPPSRKGSALPSPPEGGVESSRELFALPSPQLLFGNKPAHLHPLSLHRPRPRLRLHTFLQSSYLQLWRSENFRLPFGPSVTKPLLILAQPWTCRAPTVPAPLQRSRSPRTTDPESTDRAVANGKHADNQVGRCISFWLWQSPTEVLFNYDLICWLFFTIN